jgi:C4-dicarboxylate-specific signal transduction histidine kinase
MGDPVQSQQVLLILIMNGLEAMAPATDRPHELAITSQRNEQGAVSVTVQDWGTGLDSNDALRMFEAFFSTKADGMDIGLSISKSIIESHGGRLWATPATPHGTALHFLVPTATSAGLRST